MAKPKPRTGDRHVGTAKTIRFTDDEAAVLEAIKAKAGGTYAEAIAAAGRAYLGANAPTNAELIMLLEARLPKDSVKLARGVKVSG